VITCAAPVAAIASRFCLPSAAATSGRPDFTPPPEPQQRAGISGLVTLAHYRRPAVDGVIVPPGTGCLQFFLWPLVEAEQEHPRAVIRMTDPSVRVAVKRTLGTDVLSVAVPWRRFVEFEEDVAGSFLETAEWRELAG